MRLDWLPTHLSCNQKQAEGPRGLRGDAGSTSVAYVESFILL